MGCMQWHVGINSPLDVVTLALQPPAVMISRSIFAKVRYNFTYITSRTETIGSEVITGNRNVSQQISINLDRIHCSRAEDINFLTTSLSPIVECIYFHKNIHPNIITKRRSYSAEISRHPKFHTSLNAPTIPILLGLSTWREKKHPYKDGELELWTVLWPYEYLLTRIPLHYGIRQVRTPSWADMWIEFVLVYNLSKTMFVKFYVGLFAYREIQMRVNK